MRPRLPLALLFATGVSASIARAEQSRAPFALRLPTIAQRQFDLDSVFERAMGAAHVGLTDGKVKFLRTRHGQREDVAALIGRGARVQPLFDLNLRAASFLARFVF